MTYALDTNIIIHLLNDNPAVISRRNDAIAAGDQFIILRVVDYEIRRGLLYKPSKKKGALYQSLVAHYGIGEITVPVWNRAAEVYSDLRNAGYTVADADILIAACCIENGYTLVTNNVGDFQNINGLVFEDWVK